MSSTLLSMNSCTSPSTSQKNASRNICMMALMICKSNMETNVSMVAQLIMGVNKRSTTTKNLAQFFRMASMKGAPYAFAFEELGGKLHLIVHPLILFCTIQRLRIMPRDRATIHEVTLWVWLIKSPSIFIF